MKAAAVEAVVLLDGVFFFIYWRTFFVDLNHVMVLGLVNVLVLVCDVSGDEMSCLEAVVLKGGRSFIHCASHGQMTSQIRF